MDNILTDEIDAVAKEEQIVASQAKVYNNKLDILVKRRRMLESQLSPPMISVSDHALVQYLSRFTDINLTTIKFNIIGEIASMVIAGGGNCKVVVGKKRYVVQNYVIVTITTLNSDKLNNK